MAERGAQGKMKSPTGEFSKRLTSGQRKLIYKLFYEGYGYSSIAEKVGCSHNTVYRYCYGINKHIRETLLEDHIHERKRQMHLHMLGYEKAMAAWEKSIQDSRIVEVVKMKNKSGETVIRSKQVLKAQCGNPSLLSEARAHLSTIREIMLMQRYNEKDNVVRAGGEEVTSALEMLENLTNKTTSMEKMIEELDENVPEI